MHEFDSSACARNIARATQAGAIGMDTRIRAINLRGKYSTFVQGQAQISWQAQRCFKVRYRLRGRRSTFACTKESWGMQAVHVREFGSSALPDGSGL